MVSIKIKFFSIAFFVVILDQLTKSIVKQNLVTPIEITNFFQISLIKNTGSAFGIIKNANFLLLIIMLAVIVAIIIFYDKLPTKTNIQFAYGLILGGALGNFIDRLILGGVIDFIDFSFWPAFNIADSALSVGIIILLIDSIKNKN